MLNDILAWFGQWIASHLGVISMALASAIMVLGASRLSRGLKNSMHGYAWWLRTLAFIAMCAVGYGAMTVVMGVGIRHLLRDLSPEVLALMVPCAFIALGVMAERKGEM